MLSDRAHTHMLVYTDVYRQEEGTKVKLDNTPTSNQWLFWVGEVVGKLVNVNFLLLNAVGLCNLSPDHDKKVSD